MISITVQSSEGTVLAYAEHPEEAWLSVDRAYLPGDVIRITGSSRLRVRMDQALPAGEVFLPSGVMTWPVPAGEHRLAYAPGTFEAPRHIIFAAAVPDSGLHRTRNLALNPADRIFIPIAPPMWKPGMKPVFVPGTSSTACA